MVRVADSDDVRVVVAKLEQQVSHCGAWIRERLLIDDLRRGKYHPQHSMRLVKEDEVHSGFYGIWKTIDSRVGRRC